jgi:hypothetical protein
LVFPVDVPLVGGYIDPATRRFVLSGSYTRPARDTSQAELQPVNPFARRLIRTVTFMGAEVTSGLLRGEYSETVQGPLPFPVVMHGTFDLHRKVSNSMPASSPEARLDVTPPTAVNASAPAAKDPEPQAEAAKPAAPDSGLRLPQPEKEVKGPFPLAGTVAGLFAGPQKAPLANASIVLTGSHVQLAVTSGAEGKFVFPEVYPGVYRLSASSLGFSLAGEGPHWAERTVEVLDDGMVNAADDREGDASQLFLRRRHAPEEPEAVLAVVPIGDSPAVVQLGNVYAAPVEEWQWKISSSSLAKSDHQFFETGDPWSWKAEKPGIYKIELTLKRRQIDKSQGHFSERQATVVVGPVGVVLKPDKTLQTIPASEVPLAFRRGVAGASTPGPAICDAKPEGAGNANYRIVGANVTAPMGGVCCGMATRVSPDAIILQVGPAAIIGKETR